MFRHIALPLVLLAVAASPALAQTPRRAAPPATPEDIAIARAEADTIIARSNVSDIFENATTSRLPAVRHKSSGMECSFDPGQRPGLVVFPAAVRGDDVACMSKILDILVGVYAMRVPKQVTSEQMFRDSARSLMTVHPDAKPYKGSLAEISSPSIGLLVPKTEKAYFVFKDKDGAVLGVPDAELVSRLAVAVSDGWAFKQRISGPVDKAMAVSLVGEAKMSTLLLDRLSGSLEAQTAAAAKPAGSPPSP